MRNRFFTTIISLIICNYALSQTYSEILGRPTRQSVTLSLLFDQASEVYAEYGNSSGNYSFSKPSVILSKDVPHEIIMDGLSADTRYFYRIRYRLAGTTGNFLAGTEHSFATCRNPGKTYTFAIEADPHLDTNSSLPAYQLTLQNIRAKNPDFLIDMGDNFMSEKMPLVNDSTVRERLLMYRPLWGSVCNSSPLFLVIGNHEGELGWKNDGTSTCMPVLTANMRKLYYPNPEPDAFYTGNSHPENFTGLLQDYYSWEWGDALFVVMNPYWYTQTKPDWGWTLGANQYNWFRQVMTGSHSKYRFVFCHQVVGGKGNDGRGGAEYAPLFEMGGKNSDSSWGFTSKRPGWEKPIHQLMAEKPGTVFFHGHDHFFGKQQKDGVIYQELPQPSTRNITSMQAANYGYVTGDFIPSRGFVLVTVTDTAAKVEYIRTYLPNEETAQHKNGEVAYSYLIRSTTSGIEDKGDNTGIWLGQNFPNPFREETSIRYSIQTPARVRIELFSVTGKLLDTLSDRFLQTGQFEYVLSPAKLNLPAGVYICRLIAGDQCRSIKMTVE